MSPVIALMIFGWITTGIMIGICTLNESGRLLRYHRRLGAWLERLAQPGVKSEIPDPEQIDAA